MKQHTAARPKIAIITCYFLPDYVRSASMRAALKSLPELETIVIKNSRIGLLRYIEVIVKIIWCRLSQQPDVYILGFRGQEILPLCQLITIGKPLVFDELVVPLAWATNEKHKRSLRVSWFRMMSRLSAPLYKSWLRACRLILADTSEHAVLSSELSGVPLDHYRVLPVSTDETLFNVDGRTVPSKPDKFEVFFYGLKMTPLHGLDIILKAAVKSHARAPEVHFTIAGGDKHTQAVIEKAKTAGANITYIGLVPFSELAEHMKRSNLSLGGPFGNTEQAQHVVTGKTYQSLASGCPTIVAETSSHAEFTNKKDCLMVPLGDSQALSDAIIWALEHPKELNAIGLGGRRLYEKLYSNAAIATQLKTIIAEIVSAS